MKKCTDEEIGNRLTDFYSGHLTENESEAVLSHLKQCETCRNDLKVMGLLGEGPALKKEENSKFHLSAEQISSYYADRKSLSASDLSVVESHLKSCDHCAYELDFLRDLESDLAGSVKHAQKSVSMLARVADLVFPALRKPVVAYFLLLLTLYPTYRFLAVMNSETASSETTWNQLQEGRRSTGEAKIILRDRGATYLGFDVLQYHNVAEFRYSVTLSPAGELTRRIPVLTNFDDKQKIQVMGNFHDLPDGEYILTVEEVDPLTPNDKASQQYRFELRSR